MADVNRGNRPLSPHLQIYRLPMAAMLSILHRATGCALAGGAALTVWWFLAAATSEAYFDFVDGLMTSWIGGLIMIGALWTLCYHFSTGLRHLYWDTGRGFELDKVTKSNQIVIASSVILTLLVLIIA